jgi:ArsR family transcriptional regulator, lead/cadmium/zinc/bismuth-responsive transcriptional repressor
MDYQMKNDLRAALTDRQAEEAAGMFSALADPARLRLLLLLAAGEASVSDLAASQQENLSTVSARLKVLHAARLVGRKRQGKSIHYYLADDHVLALVASAVDHACEDH